MRPYFGSRSLAVREEDILKFLFLLYRCVQMNECSFGQEEPKKAAGPRTTGIRSGNEDAENSVCEPQPETNPRHSDPKSIIPLGNSAVLGH